MGWAATLTAAAACSTLALLRAQSTPQRSDHSCERRSVLPRCTCLSTDPRIFVRFACGAQPYSFRIKWEAPCTHIGLCCSSTRQRCACCLLAACLPTAPSPHPSNVQATHPLDSVKTRLQVQQALRNSAGPGSIQHRSDCRSRLLNFCSPPRSRQARLPWPGCHGPGHGPGGRFSVHV